MQASRTRLYMLLKEKYFSYKHTFKKMWVRKPIQNKGYLRSRSQNNQLKFITFVCLSMTR